MRRRPTQGGDESSHVDVRFYSNAWPVRNKRPPQSATAPRPRLVRHSVCIEPSVMRKMPGKRSSHGRLAAGTYWREFDSMADTPGTCAASPAEWISDAPGQLRSCTHRNMPYLRAAAAISSD